MPREILHLAFFAGLGGLVGAFFFYSGEDRVAMGFAGFMLMVITGGALWRFRQ